MKTNSKLVVLVLAHLGLASVNAMEPSHVNSDVVRIIQKEMTMDANEIIGDLSGEADDAKSPITFDSSDTRWESAGFGNTNADMRRILVLMYERYGREITFSDNEIIISPVKHKA